jgi:hypothetical protein
MFYRQRQRVEVYNDIWLDIVISDDVKRINKEFKGKEKEWYAMVFRHNFKEKPLDELKKRSVVVVLNPNHTHGVIDEGVILHEVVHLKNKIFKTHGVINSRDNDEHEAYFTEYLYRTVKKFYDEVMETEKEVGKIA